MKSTRTIAVAAIVVLGLLMSQAAFADSMFDLAPGLTADASFSAGGGIWSLSMTFTTDPGTTATVNMFTLQLFQPNSVFPPTFAVASDSSASGWSYAIDQMGNNGNSSCGSSPGHNKGALCVTGGPTSISTRGLVFSFGGTYETSGLNGNALDLMANGTADDAKWAISGTGVPEPASILLFGTGLSAVGLFVRRKLHK
ncbi:MAG: PEP-CTERM sorting domain-containing protein [Terriglobales bacterium]